MRAGADDRRARYLGDGGSYPALIWHDFMSQCQGVGGTSVAAVNGAGCVLVDVWPTSMELATAHCPHPTPMYLSEDTVSRMVPCTVHP